MAVRWEREWMDGREIRRAEEGEGGRERNST